MKKKKLTKAQERQYAIKSLLVDALSDIEEAGHQKMVEDAGYRNLCKCYGDDELIGEYCVCKEDLSPAAIARLFWSPRVQSMFKMMLRGVAYNLRCGLKSKHCVKAQ